MEELIKKLIKETICEMVENNELNIHECSLNNNRKKIYLKVKNENTWTKNK